MDDHMSATGNGGWWKGSFPTWIVAGLMGLLAYFLQREIGINDAYREDTTRAIVELQLDLTSIKARLIMLEDTSRENHDLLSELTRRVKN